MIPKPIRDLLGLKPGDAVDFLVQQPGGDVLLRPAAEDVRRLEGLLRDRVRRTVTLEEMDRAVRERATRRR